MRLPGGEDANVDHVQLGQGREESMDRGIGIPCGLVAEEVRPAVGGEAKVPGMEVARAPLDPQLGGKLAELEDIVADEAAWPERERPRDGASQSSLDEAAEEVRAERGVERRRAGGSVPRRPVPRTFGPKDGVSVAARC